MIITKQTIIDELVKNRLISSLTRDKCISRFIFRVGDLDSYIDDYGMLNIKGFSTRSISELREVLDKVSIAQPLRSSTDNKPRKLVRILTAEEKETISELEDLFESSFLGNKKSDSKEEHSLIEIGKIDLKPVEEEIEIGLSEIIEKGQAVLTFYEEHGRFPRLASIGEERKLALWLDEAERFPQKMKDSKAKDFVESLVLMKGLIQ